MYPSECKKLSEYKSKIHKNVIEAKNKQEMRCAKTEKCIQNLSKMYLEFIKNVFRIYPKCIRIISENVHRMYLEFIINVNCQSCIKN